MHTKYIWENNLTGLYISEKVCNKEVGKYLKVMINRFHQIEVTSELGKGLPWLESFLCKVPQRDRGVEKRATLRRSRASLEKLNKRHKESFCVIEKLRATRDVLYI